MISHRRETLLGNLSFRFCKRRWKLFSSCWTKFPSRIERVFTATTTFWRILRISIGWFIVSQIQINGKIKTKVVNFNNEKRRGTRRWMFWWLQRLMPRQGIAISPIQRRLRLHHLYSKFTFSKKLDKYSTSISFDWKVVKYYLLNKIKLEKENSSL